MGKTMGGSFWTLDGREQLDGPTRFIVRSCPKCGIERSAPADDVPRLDHLRMWAVGHPAVCRAKRGRTSEAGYKVARRRSMVRSIPRSYSLFAEARRAGLLEQSA